MGYCTNYELETDADFDTRERIDAEIENYAGAKYAIGSSKGQATKWYGWQTDMIAISKKFPKVTFILGGVGEEFPDIWKARIKNGVVEKVEAQIIYPPFKGK